MSDEQTLLAAIAAFYLYECLSWLPVGAVAFTGHRSARMVFCGDCPGNDRGGIFLAPPLPPFSGTFRSPCWPVAADENGIYAGPIETPDSSRRGVPPQRYHRFADIREVDSRHREILINGCPFARAADADQAAAVADWVRPLIHRSPRQRREAVARHLEAATDTGALRARLDQYRKTARGTALWSESLLYLMLIGGPFLVWRYGAVAAVLPILGLLLVLLGGVCLSYYRAHSRLYPGCRGERRLHLLMFLCAPPMAVRAADLLGHHALDAWHPLTAAAVLLPPSRFADVARRWLLDLKYPLCRTSPDLPEAASAARASYTTALAARLEALIERRGESVAALLTPPLPSGSEDLSYCPRCLAHFTIADGLCRECDDLPLIPFDVPTKMRAGRDPDNAS